jgi:hypothetical protein
LCALQYAPSSGGSGGGGACVITKAETGRSVVYAESLAGACEGICFDGPALVIDSERVGTGRGDCDGAAPFGGMMRGMTLALPEYKTSTWVLLIAAGLVLLSVIAAFVGRALIRRGIREPFFVRFINRTSERVVAVIKRPITVAVLDEVAEVLRTGHYTHNIAAALDENHQEIKNMITEKVRADPMAARSIGLLPFHERIIEEVTEAALRVIFEVLSDPRTDELVSDILRDNINQIRSEVSAREL